MRKHWSSKYDLGELVALKIDPEGTGMITQVCFEGLEQAKYLVTWTNATYTYHYEYEIIEGSVRTEV